MLLPQIILEGDAYNKGLIHGKCCKNQVLRSLETYKHRYSTQRGLSWDMA